MKLTLQHLTFTPKQIVKAKNERNTKGNKDISKRCLSASSTERKKKKKPEIKDLLDGLRVDLEKQNVTKEKIFYKRGEKESNLLQIRRRNLMNRGTRPCTTAHNSLLSSPSNSLSKTHFFSSQLSPSNIKNPNISTLNSENINMDFFSICSAIASPASSIKKPENKPKIKLNPGCLRKNWHKTTVISKGHCNTQNNLNCEKERDLTAELGDLLVLKPLLTNNNSRRPVTANYPISKSRTNSEVNKNKSQLSIFIPEDLFPKNCTKTSDPNSKKTRHFWNVKRLSCTQSPLNSHTPRIILKNKKRKSYFKNNTNSNSESKDLVFHSSRRNKKINSNLSQSLEPQSMNNCLKNIKYPGKNLNADLSTIDLDGEFDLKSSDNILMNVIVDNIKLTDQNNKPKDCDSCPQKKKIEKSKAKDGVVSLSCNSSNKSMKSDFLKLREPNVNVRIGYANINNNNKIDFLQEAVKISSINISPASGLTSPNNSQSSLLKAETPKHNHPKTIVEYETQTIPFQSSKPLVNYVGQRRDTLHKSQYSNVVQYDQNGRKTNKQTLQNRKKFEQYFSIFNGIKINNGASKIRINAKDIMRKGLTGSGGNFQHKMKVMSNVWNILDGEKKGINQYKRYAYSNSKNRREAFYSDYNAKISRKHSVDEIEKLKKTRLEGKENKKRKRSKSKNKESRKELKLMIDAKFFEIKLDPNRKIENGFTSLEQQNAYTCLFP